MNRLMVCAIVLTFLGAGCALPWANQTPTAALPEPLCVSWSTPEGFHAWISAYTAGDREAIALAGRIQLPSRADEKLVADLAQSLDAGGLPSFLCTLDSHGRNVAWVMEFPDEASDTCTDSFYVSIDGEGTTSDFTAAGREGDCTQLCKPKRLEENLLVWQCDLREKNDRAAWTQLHMSRHTGETELLGCQEDALGIPSGCVR